MVYPLYFRLILKIRSRHTKKMSLDQAEYFIIYYLVTNEGVSIILVTNDRKLILKSSFIYSL